MFWSKLAVQALFLGASLTDASPILSNEARDLRSCNNNLALSALKLLQATNFCTDFLKITTVTIQSTASKATVVPGTTTTSTTNTIATPVLTTSTATRTTTTVSTVDGPSVTVTSTVTGTVTSVIVNSFATTTTTTTTTTSVQYVKNMRRRSVNTMRQDAVAERENILAKLVARGKVDLKPRAPVIPSQLKAFASSVISTACGCYVTTPTTTVATTTTSTSTSFTTATAAFTTHVPGSTVVVPTETVTTTTTTTTLPGMTTTTNVGTTTTLLTTTSTTTTNVVVSTVTATTTSPTFTRAFSGNNCVYNEYVAYDLINEPYSTPDRLFQVCAADCASHGSQCKFFFAYQDNQYPYQWCIIDNKPYQPSYLQCGIPFSGVDLGYNSPY